MSQMQTTDGSHFTAPSGAYDATLVSDVHTTEDLTEWGAPLPEQVVAHTNLYWTHHAASVPKAGMVETKNVDFDGTA